MVAANTYGRQVVTPLTNKSGGGVIAGDVVVVDTTNNDAFTTTTTAATTDIVGVAQDTIASNAVGRVLLQGYAALVNVNASVTRGHYGATHTVAKQAADAGALRIGGTFCKFLTGGTTPDAIVWNPAGADGPGALLGLVVDTASGSVAITSATLVDVDAANALATFIAPASTNVLVRITGSGTTSGDINAYVGVREGGSIVGTKSYAMNSQGLRDDQFSCVVYITGLSAGSHTYKIAAATNSGTFTLRSASGSPLAMEVWSAP